MNPNRAGSYPEGSNIQLVLRLRKAKYHLSLAFGVHVMKLTMDPARAKAIMLANGIPEDEADAFIAHPHISLRKTSDAAVDGRITVLLGLDGYDTI